MQSTCIVCAGEFERPSKSVAKTCSSECREKYRVQRTIEVSRREGAWVTKSCAVCGKEFTRRKSKIGVVCSTECRAAKQKKDGLEARTCATCGKTFDNYHRQDQRTCSVKCAAAARSTGRTYPPCERCGQPTGAYDRVFCDAHRGSRKGRKPMPRKVAICLCCGEEFSRPGYWSSKMKYCSNACSHRQVKSVRDKYIADLPEGAVVFHSGWEVRFWACCLRLDIPIRSYDGPDIETSVGGYRPDFIVGPDELVVDVKGWAERPGTAEKLAESGVHMIGRKELAALESATDPTEVIVILRKA